MKFEADLLLGWSSGEVFSRPELSRRVVEYPGETGFTDTFYTATALGFHAVLTITRRLNND